MSTGGKKGGKKGKGGKQAQDQEKVEDQAGSNPTTETTNEAPVVPQEENKVDDAASTTASTTTAPSESGATTTTTDSTGTENTQASEPKAENNASDSKPNLTIDIADPNSATPSKEEKLVSPKVETAPEKLASPKVEVAPKESPKKPETPKKVETPKKEESVTIVEKTPEKKEPEPVVPQANVNAASEKKEVPKEVSPPSSQKKDEEPVIVENNSLTKSWQVVDKDTSVDTASDRAQDADDSKSDTFSISSRPSIETSAQKATNDQNNAHERYDKADRIYHAAIKNREKGDYDTARQNLHEAVETLDPKYFKHEDVENVKAKIYVYTCEIASTYLQQRNYTEALKFAQSVKNNSPNNVKAIYLIGQAYAGKNDNQEALKSYLQVRTIKDIQDKATVSLIEGEISRLEKLKKPEEPSSSQINDEPPAKPIPVTKVPSAPEEKKSEAPKKDNNTAPTPSSESNAGVQLFGYFVGTSTLAFLTSKFLFKQPLNKSLVAAGVLGVVGAITQYFMDKGSSEEKKEKK